MSHDSNYPQIRVRRFLQLSQAAFALIAMLVVPSGWAGANASAPNTPQVHYTALPKRLTVTPVINCGTLAGEAFDRHLASAASVLSARVVTVQGRRQRFCLVRGYVAPTIQFSLWMPTEGYTGRYLQGGCGGNCGVIMHSFAPSADNRLAFDGAFAVGFEDSGHVGGDGVWALGGSEVRKDFAFRAAHVFSLAARRILAQYYGVKPRFSYFDGCSDGGREAMMETQRYPADFNGVIAGAPAFPIAEAMERFIWESRWGYTASGKSVWTINALHTLHDAVISACDAKDGLKDGQIDDSRLCHFQPSRLLCKPDQTSHCLTQRQVEAADAFYQGPVSTHGIHLFYGGEPYGSELTWDARFSIASAGRFMLHDVVRDMIFNGRLSVAMTSRSWPFSLKMFNRLRRAGAIYDANDSNLAAFRAAGGKLILWQGAADMAAGAYSVPDYYQRLEDAAGSLSKTKQFARYFIIPAVYHCGGGYIPYNEDLLGPLVRWVERGKAPRLIVTTAQLANGQVRTRPVYPFPTEEHYVGHGNVNSYHNFKPQTPAHSASALYDWAGSSRTDN